MTAADIIRPPEGDRSAGFYIKIWFFGKIRFWDFWTCGKWFLGHFENLNFLWNFRFSIFRQISPLLSYIWIVRSIFAPMLSHIWIVRSIFAHMLSYIWIVRSIFAHMLMSRGVAGGRGGSRGVAGRAPGGGAGGGKPISTSSVTLFFVFVYHLTLMSQRHMFDLI